MGVAPVDYAPIVIADLPKNMALAAELVVPETWFFRGGRRLMDELARFVSARVAGAPVRILSIPSSTGEEPYSLALALHELGVSSSACQIEGLDLSAANVARATEGRFSNFAFRDTDAEVRERYFRPSGNRWELDASIREAVHFRTGNAVNPDFLVGEAPFDLILCRNLFIYLTNDARRQVIANLDRLLTPGGWLVLSPAEADRLPPGRFVAIGPREFGIYRRAGASEAPIRPSDDFIRPPAYQATPRMPPLHVPVAARDALSQKAHGSKQTQPVSILELARELADAGRLPQARAACEQLIGQTTDDPEVYSLLGVVRLAQGSPEDAAVAFRKALYLDPNQAEAIAHMIVICDARGDAAQAASLRRRLARLTAKEQS